LTPVATQTFHKLEIDNCILEAAMEGLGVHGQNSAVPQAGSVLVTNCEIRAGKRGLGMYGGCDLRSINNRIRVRADAAHMDFVAEPDIDGSMSNNWFMGAGINIWHASDVAPGSQWLSQADLFEVVVDQNYPATDNNESGISGIKVWDAGTAGASLMLPIKFVGPQILVTSDIDKTPANGVAGIHVHAEEPNGNPITVGEDMLVVTGGFVHVRQLNTGAAAPAAVDGVRVDATSSTGTGSALLKLHGYPSVRVENAIGTPYSLHAVTAGIDTIEGPVQSDQATRGAGTIVAAPTKP